MLLGVWLILCFCLCVCTGSQAHTLTTSIWLPTRCVWVCANVWVCICICLLWVCVSLCLHRCVSVYNKVYLWFNTWYFYYKFGKLFFFKLPLKSVCNIFKAHLSIFNCNYITTFMNKHPTKYLRLWFNRINKLFCFFYLIPDCFLFNTFVFSIYAREHWTVILT